MYSVSIKINKNTNWLYYDSCMSGLKAISKPNFIIKLSSRIEWATNRLTVFNNIFKRASWLLSVKGAMFKKTGLAFHFLGDVTPPSVQIFVNKGLMGS